MAIKSFERISNYFSGFEKINAGNIDLQFNHVSDYFNNDIFKILDSLSQGRIPASESSGDINKFLYNVGDGNVIWKGIDNGAFKDKSLSLKKLVRSNSGSIFITNSDSKLRALAPEVGNQVVVLADNNIPEWSLLTGKNINGRAIGVTNVALNSIEEDNLPPGLLRPLIKTDSIDGSKFNNNAITSDKIADYTLTIEKLTSDFAAKFVKGVWSSIVPDNYLAGSDIRRMLGNTTHANREEVVRIFKDSAGPTITTNALGQGQGETINRVFSASKFGSTIDSQDRFAGIHIHGKIHALKKLKENSIDAARVALLWSEVNTSHRFVIRKNLSRFLSDGTIGLEHLVSSLRNAIEAKLEAK